MPGNGVPTVGTLAQPIYIGDLAAAMIWPTVRRLLRSPTAGGSRLPAVGALRAGMGAGARPAAARADRLPAWYSARP